MTTERLTEVSANKTAAEIKEMFEILRESIRQNLSRHLMDTSEDNRMKLDFPLESGACGLSTLEMIWVDEIWQDPEEGIIWVKYEGSSDAIELDEVPIDWQIDIVEGIENM